MVGVVVNIDHLGGVEIDLEAALYALKLGKSFEQPLLVEVARSPESRHCCHAIFHIYLATHAKPATRNCAVGADDVVAECTIAHRGHILGVEVRLGVPQIVGVLPDTLVVMLEIQAVVLDECATLGDALHKLPKGTP